ncbi:phage tail protein (plasmid) [Ralstonia syzygii subsp. celebesensis]|uniref:phage tail protein n=1 Tax=Ralstonia syzygii TaxID=28097 RepID=UPI0024B49F4D|nr:phage tail protein [Ralstonia syzygii]
MNACLDTMGEAPLNALDLDHPFVAAALNKLNEANTLEQTRGWWFNTDGVQLTPDVTTGYVYVPADTLDLRPPYPSLTQRGRRMYDRTNSTFDLRTLASQAGGSFNCVVVREIPFDDLPVLAQHLVKCRAALSFQASFDGDGAKYSKIGGEYQQVFNLLSSENIRNERINFTVTPSIQEKLRLIRPMYRQTRSRW